MRTTALDAVRSFARPYNNPKLESGLRNLANLPFTPITPPQPLSSARITAIIIDAADIHRPTFFGQLYNYLLAISG